MGQKVHPIGFRVGVTQEHSVQWFAKADQYASLIQEDRLIRKFFTQTCKESGISKITLTRKVERIDIELHVARPAVILGRNGSGLEKLRNDLKQTLGKTFGKQVQSRQFAIQVIELTEPDKEARLIAEFVASQLEKRIPFRKAMKQGLQRAVRAGVTGIKIQVSGRLNGAEIARSEWVREGRVPLQTLRAEIDYCNYEAQTIYGIIGIKVWVAN
jgi:small subunit ribosomal protein S3|tara:strand:+ start:5310 stop:5951 length:642 start_codon:yes stop_codon:yes gene_type:complete